MLTLHVPCVWKENNNNPCLKLKLYYNHTLKLNLNMSLQDSLVEQAT